MANAIWASVAAVSWIDPRSGLPLVDNPPGDDLKRGVVTKNNEAHRFCNFLEVGIKLTSAGKLDGFQFGPYSFLYTGISALDMASRRFPVLQHYERHGDTMLFRQTVGARTETPERVGQIFGGVIGGGVAGPVGGIIGEKIGKHAARRVTKFAPIWSDITIELSSNGMVKTRINRHSLFPSLTMYEQVEAYGEDVGRNFKQKDYAAQTHHYDGVPNVERWKADGWGKLVNGTQGPVEGNPWNIELSD